MNLEEKHERITGKNPFSDSVAAQSREGFCPGSFGESRGDYSADAGGYCCRIRKQRGLNYSLLQTDGISRIAFTAAIAEGEEIHEEGIEETDGIEVILKKVFQSNVQTLQNTMVLANDGYQAALDAIISAKSIHFFGVGDAFAACQFAFMKFCRLGIPCSAYSDVMLQYITADNLRPGDVALAISYEGRSRNVVQAMKIAKLRGATTISITKMNKSPLLKYTDISLFTSVSDLTVGRDKVTRRVADQFILDVLYLGYITKTKRDYSKRLKRTQTAIDCNKLM